MYDWHFGKLLGTLSIYIPVKPFKIIEIVTIGCSKRKIHSMGARISRAIPTSCPINEDIKATVTKS